MLLVEGKKGKQRESQKCIHWYIYTFIHAYGQGTRGDSGVLGDLWKWKMYPLKICKTYLPLVYCKYLDNGFSLIIPFWKLLLAFLFIVELRDIEIRSPASNNFPTY